jgi:hypothetical protein
MAHEESRVAAHLYDNAKCHDDAILFETQERYLVLEAIKVCNGCSVRRECLEVISPYQSFFDGVAGGFLWKDGRRVNIEGQILLEPEPRTECGSPYGYEKHRRSAERACTQCLEAVREQKARNRSAQNAQERIAEVPEF